MARIRSIKPEFFTDEDLGALPPTTRLLFIGMWCEADKAGRLKDKPKTLKARCLPFDNVDIEKALTLLADGRFIIRYTVAGEQFIQIRTWDQHQRPHHTERDSLFPESGNGDLTVKQPLSNGVNVSVNPPFPSLPSSLQSADGFPEAWDSWVRHRKQIKKPLTGEQVAKQLKTFEEWGAARSIAAIEHTIRQGWQGLREPDTGKGKPAATEEKSYEEYERDRQRRLQKTRDLLAQCQREERSGQK